MKKAILVLLLAFTVAVGAYLAFFYSATRVPHSLLRTDGGEMEWLRKEFKLTDSQYQRIQNLHVEYQPTCRELCSQVSAANRRLREITRQSPAMSPEVAAALKECMRVQEECRRAMIGHIYAVSAEMPDESRGRYVQLMVSHLVQPPIMEEKYQGTPPPHAGQHDHGH